jgi:hypothetical protein
MLRIRSLFERGTPTLLGLLVILSLALGCGSSPKPASPEAARKALNTVFESWKSGKTQEDVTRQSSIHSNDSYWTNGYKLLEYNIATGEEGDNYGLTFQVTLQLLDKEGNKVEDKATYKVETSPRLVVIRVEEM